MLYHGIELSVYCDWNRDYCINLDVAEKGYLILMNNCLTCIEISKSGVEIHMSNIQIMFNSPKGSQERKDKQWKQQKTQDP